MGPKKLVSFFLFHTILGKNFNIGKSFVVDGTLKNLDLIVETTSGAFKNQISIDNIENSKVF